MTRRAGASFAIALVGLAIGGAAALLAASRPWLTIIAPRDRPLADDVLDVTGRTLYPAVTGLALVALAGVVGVLATRGTARRIVGVVLVLTGGGLCWQAVRGLWAVSAGPARGLLRDARNGVGLAPDRSLGVAVHAGWPIVAALGGVVVILAGALTAVRGPTWRGLSRRYDAPEPGALTDATLWTALDRGADPTSDGPSPADPVDSTTDPPARTQP
jgi:uncharacterized membrane protein (TIGR02234 family)